MLSSLLLKKKQFFQISINTIITIERERQPNFTFKLFPFPTFQFEHRGRDRMIVRFTTTYAISAYQH